MSVEFSYRWRHSYKEYIAQQYLRDNVDVVVAKSVREAVGSIKDVYGDNADRVGAGLTEIRYRIDQTNETLELISFRLGGIQDKLDVANFNIVSGFQALFVKADELNDSLAHISCGIESVNRSINTLIGIARTPAQTWAYNQYEIARDALRRKLFPEALEALNFAINGSPQNAGHKTDYHFHQLRGVLLLGIPGEPDTVNLVDLEAAECSFLLAARYAHYDNPSEAAQALVGAGKAAYADGRLPDSEKHYAAALQTDPRCGEANYQMARLWVHAKDANAIQSYLSAACNIHWSFAMRAAEDAQFSHITNIVEKCVRSTTEAIIQESYPSMLKIVRDMKFIKEREIELCPVQELSEHLILIDKIKEARDALETKRLKDVYDIRRNIPRNHDTLEKFVASYCERLQLNETRIVEQGATDTVSASPRRNPEAIATTISSYVTTGLVIVELIVYLTIISREASSRFFIADFIALLILPGVFVAIGLGSLTFVVNRATYYLTYAVVVDSNQAKEHGERSYNESITEANRTLVVRNRALLHQSLGEIRSHFAPRSEIQDATFDPRFNTRL